MLSPLVALLGMVPPVLDQSNTTSLPSAEHVRTAVEPLANELLGCTMTETLPIG